MAESPPDDVGLAALEVRVDPDPVAGAPIHAAIVVRPNRRHMTLNGLPCVDWFGLRGAIGIDVRSLDTGERVARLEVSARDFDADRSTYTLGDGESRRMLVDLSEYLDSVRPAVDAQGGAWSAQLVVSHGLAGFAGESAPFTLHVRAPTPGERAILARARPERDAAASWGGWAQSRSAADAPLEPLRGAPAALWFAAATRALMFGRQPLSAADRALVESLPAFYAPERDMLETEIAQALGDDTRRAAASNDAGMGHRIAALAAGEGWLRWRRAGGWR